MCIQQKRTVHYLCGCNVDENGDLDTCDAMNNGEECAGVEEQPAPSESDRTQDCPSCAAAKLAASPSTEPESEKQE